MKLLSFLKSLFTIPPEAPPMSIDKFEGKYRFLSNFWPSTVEMDGVEYPSIEHAYQAAKTDDPEVRQKILAAPTPGRAKSLGKHVKLKDGWDDSKLTIMESLLRKKFSQPEFKKMLLETGNAELTEGNWWGDTFWGQCNGYGHNHLGVLLMKIRDELGASS